ncbi:unnamed protein product [Allacma fusca]|uniref:ABC transporter domain-containing protein n=1 Tax=Allacma fusca TaxID=39272 RepID=A0A8J2LS73_9HEXA|nr:unnamed protein product [Allacma fusca]
MWREDPEVCDQLKDAENSCHLTFSNLQSVPIPGNPFILSEISGEVRPGEVLAVMGPTGCGKTSLLNSLSGRLRLESGSIRLNGENLCKRLRRSKIGYVLQHDVFFADLTLKQTLNYTALLRLPDRKFTRAEKLEKVEEIIDILDLRRCQDTIIGDVMKRGLSGGEKKRLSIACELITNPSVLLIDEPTSGLDSCTASHLMLMLKEYALKESKSVVLAVHQPSSKIFHLFDRLLLLSDGQTAYFGQASHVISHFASLGLHIAPHYNPADFILEQLKNEKSRILSGWSNHVNAFHLQISSAKSDLNDFNGNQMLRHSSESSLSTWPTSFFTQTRVLAARNFREARPRMLSKLNWLQTLALAIMAGLIWLKTERKEESLSDLEGFMFFSTTYWMLFALFGALASFPSERAVVEKERLSGAYRLSAYYVAKMIGEAPLVIVLPSVYLAVAYPLLGGSVVAFFGLLFVQMLASLAAQSAGLFFGAALNLSASVTAAAVFTLAAQLLGGYLANNVPSYLKTLSLVYHGYRNMQLLEYNIGERIRCAKTEISRFEGCPTFGNGTEAVDNSIDYFIPTRDLLNRDGLSWLPYWSSTLFLLAFFVFFRVLGYIALRRSL